MAFEMEAFKIISVLVYDNVRGLMAYFTFFLKVESSEVSYLQMIKGIGVLREETRT